MPTAAKLFAAIWFAAAGWLAANAHVPALGEHASVGTFREITALLGLGIGWLVLGAGTGKGYGDSMAAGLKTSVILAFFALLVFSGHQMIQEAFWMRYDGPVEAILGWCALMLKNAQKMLSVGVIGVLVLAGLIGGPIAEWAWQRWK